MFWSSRNVIIILAFVFLIGGGYAANRLWSSYGAVPKEFVDARLQGALISQNIVGLSNQSVFDLGKINQLAYQGKLTEALSLTTDVVKQSQGIRDQAVSLSAQIETMTKSLSDIGSLDAREAALEGITNRLALLSRLINYSGYLGQLLDILHDSFTSKSTKGSEVGKLVDQINGEVRAINSFDNQASQAMERFDKIVNR